VLSQLSRELSDGAAKRRSEALTKTVFVQEEFSGIFFVNLFGYFLKIETNSKTYEDLASRD
jgi:hypothetical protein